MAKTQVTGVYRIAADRCAVTFQTNHLFGLTNVTGTFAIRSGHIVITAPITASTAQVSIDPASFTTGNRRRDAAVRSARFLDATRHPDITFTSHGIRRCGGQWLVHGDLTVRATTRPVELAIEHVEITDDGLRARATALIDRFAFGLTRAKAVTARYLNLILDVTAARDRGPTPTRG
jgi:polyisoprenoid-binding protein YceI